MKVFDWNCKLYIRFHCIFEKLRWFACLLCSFKKWLSRGMERSNAVLCHTMSLSEPSCCRKALTDCKLSLQQATAPEHFTKVNSEVCCRSSWNPLSKFFLDYCRCSTFCSTGLRSRLNCFLYLVNWLESPKRHSDKTLLALL